MRRVSRMRVKDEKGLRRDSTMRVRALRRVSRVRVR